MQNSELTKALLTIGEYLPASTAITIFPFDRWTNRVMVEGHGLEVDDVVRRRVEISPEMLRADPTAGDHLIDQLVTEIEHISNQLNTQSPKGHHDPEEERRRIRRNKNKGREGHPTKQPEGRTPSFIDLKNLMFE